MIEGMPDIVNGGMKMDRQNLTLLTDLYELTMMQGYFKNKDRNETVIFDAFYRCNPCDGGFAIAAGLEQLIQYIKELRGGHCLSRKPRYFQQGLPGLSERLQIHR